MGLVTFIRKLFSSCACQSTSDDAALPPPRLATLAQAPLLPPPPPSRATLAAAAPPPRPKRYSFDTFITDPPVPKRPSIETSITAPRKNPVYRFTSSVYTVPSKYPSIREKYPSVRSQCAVVFCAEDYQKELETIPFSRFSTTESSKPRARHRLPSGMF
jgi:hypothetical protein